MTCPEAPFLTGALQKRVDIAHHFVRNCVSRGELQLEYIRTSKQLADFLTNALGPKELHSVLQALGIEAYQATSRESVKHARPWSR